MNQEKDLLSAVRELVDAHFSDLRRTVRKNLARLTCAFLHLAWSIRFGYGGLHLTSIARVLPQGKKFKSSYKWLSRFLKCKYFDASSLAECMLAVILGQKPPSWVMVLVDQTTVNGVELVNAATPFQGRAVPVAWVDFEYRSPFAKHHRTLPAHLVGTGGPPRGTTDFDFRPRLRPGGVDQGFKARAAAVPHSRSPQSDRADQSAGPSATAELGAAAPSQGPSDPLSPRPLPQSKSRTGRRDRVSRERISRALVFNRAAGFRSLAPHRRSCPAVSPTYANRAVFPGLEKSPGAARPASPGREIATSTAPADGIHACLSDCFAVGSRSVRRTAPAAL